MKWIIFASLLIVTSCTQMTSLNMRKHQFGQQPAKIVWLQIAGLTEEQLALLRFSYPNVENRTHFESMLCTGKMWNFNLYHLRPTAQQSFAAQVSGKKDVKDDCSDFELKPIWNYLALGRYKSGVLEVGINSQNTLLKVKSCGQNTQNYLSGLSLWTMQQAPQSEKVFIATEPQNFKEGEVYYDRACGKEKCFSSMGTNIVSLYESHFKNDRNSFFLVRDFSLETAIQKQQWDEVRSILQDWDKVVGYFQEKTEQDSELLLLITSGAERNLEFPQEGKEWYQFDHSKKVNIASRASLTSTVYTQGARAENFCGFFEEAGLLERILTGPKQQGLEFRLINPFN